MAKTDDSNAKANRDNFAVVGELVLAASALDVQVAKVIIEVLDLGTSPMLLPVIVTIDSVRKIEILKERVAHMPKGVWTTKLDEFITKVESVFKHRNIACHTPLSIEAGNWTLRPVAAAKLMKRLQLEKGKLNHFSINDLRNAISTAEKALVASVNLVENFKRVNVKKHEHIGRITGQPIS